MIDQLSIDQSRETRNDEWEIGSDERYLCWKYTNPVDPNICIPINHRHGVIKRLADTYAWFCCVLGFFFADSKTDEGLLGGIEELAGT